MNRLIRRCVGLGPGVLRITRRLWRGRQVGAALRILVAAVIAAQCMVSARADPVFDHFRFTIGSSDGSVTGYLWHNGSAAPYLEKRQQALDGTLSPQNLVSQTPLTPEESVIWGPGYNCAYGYSMCWLNTIKSIPADAMVELRLTFSWEWPSYPDTHPYHAVPMIDTRRYYKMDTDVSGSGDTAAGYLTEYWQEADDTYTMAKGSIMAIPFDGGTANNPPDLSEIHNATYKWAGYLNVYTGDYTFDDSQGMEVTAYYAHFGEEDLWGNMQPDDPGCLVTGGTFYTSGPIDSSFTVIPEPGTVVLLVCGGLGLLLLRRKLRRRKQVGAALRILVAAVIATQCVVSAPADVWYVNPGESIQAAIDGAGAGDTINVAAGTYSEHLTIPTSDLTLLGENKYTTIIDARQDSSWSVAKAGILIGEYPYVDGVGGVNISGFTIQNARLDENGNPYSDGKYGVGPGGLAGIQIYNSSDNTIEDNILVNNYWQTWLVAEWAAAGYSECKNNRITDNIIKDSDADGVYLYSDGTVFVEDTQVVGNEIFNLTGTYTSGVEFYGWKAGTEDPAITGTVVEGNDIYDCTYGVRIRSGVGDITGTYINHNKIYDNTSHGVRNYLTTVLDTQNNWWGDATGPYHPTLNPAGLGNQVSDYVDFEPWASTAIPEPGTVVLLVCGLVALLFAAAVRRRRRA